MNSSSWHSEPDPSRLKRPSATARTINYYLTSGQVTEEMIPKMESGTTLYAYSYFQCVTLGNKKSSIYFKSQKWKILKLKAKNILTLNRNERKWWQPSFQPHSFCFITKSHDRPEFALLIVVCLSICLSQYAVPVDSDFISLCFHLYHGTFLCV